ncbi:SDR family NAD(P)-dependent oxidoreductase [Bremerella sp. JC817]|uniref:SDR family NAD(P)-dependent oxidoreductase n=1 Tax=Bremerella sp. JC817 TaxID=3231756 RepID=UPI0034589936
MNDLAFRLSQLPPSRLQLLRREIEQSVPYSEPIAIVGMGCRFPGAPDLAAFWRLISEGRNAVGEIPEDRWNVDEFYDPTGTPGKMTTRFGGFLKDVDQFDAAFFGISPREAAKIDPQQRLLLEIAWEALEAASIAPQRLRGSSTGVFVGIGAADYAKIPISYHDYYRHIDAHSGTGNALSIASNRLSYVFDWHGPSLSVDTACSSSLVALHLAANSLRSRECDMALAAGVNMILTPETTVAFSNARMLSPDGMCRPFDRRANGYVRGEGAGLVVLKRVTDAIAQGDQILAVVRGTAVNQDGRTSGISAPNSHSQEAVIREALANAALLPSDISYIEAHGTGTPLGDPIEFEALKQVFRRDSSDDPVCHMSSLKANTGHMETAAGIAGLIKTVLMLNHRQLVPQANFEQLNPLIQFEGTRLQIPTQISDWPESDGPRRAGISSFGFGGTNSHVILEEASAVVRPQPVTSPSTKLVTLSGKSPAVVQTIAKRLDEVLEQTNSINLDSMCFSANVGRNDFGHAVAIPFADASDLRKKLQETFANGQGKIQRRPTKPPKVAFVFTGQGGQYATMGKELYETQPLFRETLDQCAALLREEFDFELLEIIFAEAEASRISNTEFTQPALYAVEYSLAMLWISWGIEPAAVMGHSIGEFVGAAIAGIFSWQDGLRLVTQRGRLMQSTAANGAMAAIFCGPDRLAGMLQGNESLVSIAACNGPANTVISGRKDVVADIVKQCEQQGIKTQQLQVSHAFHSPLMNDILDEFEEFAVTIPMRVPRLPIISNLTGTLLAEAPGPKYWREHVAAPVQFEQGLRSLVALQPDVVLESGPSPTLIAMGKRFIDDAGLTWLPSLRSGHSDWKVLMQSLAELYHLGGKIRWENIAGGPAPERISLPTYPFERKRHWHQESGRRDSGPRASQAAAGQHPLLGIEIPTPLNTTVFESEVDAYSPAYLAEHRVQGSPVMPAAGYLEQALNAALKLFGDGPVSVEEVSIQQAMTLSVESTHRLQCVLEQGTGSEHLVFKTYSRPLEGDKPWTMHAIGKLVRSSQRNKPEDVLSPERDRAEQFPNQIESGEFYQRMRQIGLDYGDRFQVVSKLSVGNGEALAQLQISEQVASESKSHKIHPAILDGCLQATAGVVPTSEDGTASNRTYLPTGVGRFELLGNPLEAVEIYALRTSNANELDAITADLFLLDASGRTLVELRGVVAQSLGIRRKGKEDATQLLYRVHWTEAKLPELPVPTAIPGKAWLVLGDSSDLTTATFNALRETGTRIVRAIPGNNFGQLDEDLWQLDFSYAEDFRSLFSAAFADAGLTCHGIVYVPHDPESTDAGIEDSHAQLWGSTLTMLQQTMQAAVAPRPLIVLATQGAQVITGDETCSPAHAMLWGLGRTASLEFPGASIRLIDLDRSRSAADSAADLTAELLASDGESQVVRRGGRRLVARLAPAKSGDQAPSGRSKRLVIPREPFKLNIEEPGSFDRLELGYFQPPDLEANQVQLEVHATGLNFSDILKAMGLYPGLPEGEIPLGIECSGVVTAVGSDVTRFQVGDEVIGVAPYSLASHAITADYALVKKPQGLSHAEASTVPITFMTAHYALCWQARLSKGERVLIHAAAGGVGQAAIQIAQHVGAEVFATAGSDEKQQFLRDMGVQHIFQSRTLEFAEQIREVTDGNGVDVVLNSLPGDAITKSIAILSAYGRFLEIGKTDIYQNRMIGLLPFQDNLSYFAIDLDRMLRQRPHEIEKLFAEVMELFDRGIYRPLPLTQFAADEVATAFRYMAQRKNIGKIVVTMAPGQRSLGAEATPTQPIRKDATYLITGGLGALGLRLAEWLIDQGAGHLLLMSRRSPTAEQQQALAPLLKRAKVECLQADVSNRESLEQALASLPNELPPVVGIIHAAGVLADGILYDMPPEQFSKPLGPKVQGAWNLHEISANWPLEFFVLFSSISSVLGSPGQANYSAANAFLDGLAHYRRLLGLPAVSINWGPWAESGMATAQGKSDQISGRGMRLIEPTTCLGILQRLLVEGETTQVSVIDVDWPALARQMPKGAPPFFANFASHWETDGSANAASSQIDETFLAKLREAGDDQQRVLRFYLANELARIIDCEVDDLEPDQQLSAIGVDSLMAMELKTNLEGRLGVEIPMSHLMEGPSISSLTDVMLPSLCGDATATSEAKSETSATYHSSSTVVPLQTNGEAPPLVFVHPVGGDIRCYLPIAKQLEGVRRVLAIRPDSLDERGQWPTSVEAMCESYCAALRKQRPEGPYLLAGWSTGGIFAYEMAQRLRSEGAEVELMFLDTPTAEILDHVDLDDHVRFLYDLVNFSNWFSGAKIRLEYTELTAIGFEAAMEKVLQEARQHGVLPAGATLEDLRRRVDMCRHHLELALNYRPAPLGLPVQMYRPQHTAVLSMASGRRLDDDLGWGPVLGNDLVIHRVEGDHFSMLADEQAASIASILSDYLRKVAP